MSEAEADFHEMREPTVEKVVVHMGVGEGGRELADAEEFLQKALPLSDIAARQFDDTGNFSFGVEEHTEFPSQEYDPNIGIYGLDVTVNLVRPGYRVSKRDKVTRSIPSGHQLTPQDAIAYIESNFDVEVNE